LNTLQLLFSRHLSHEMHNSLVYKPVILTRTVYWPPAAAASSYGGVHLWRQFSNEQKTFCSSCLRISLSIWSWSHSFMYHPVPQRHCKFLLEVSNPLQRRWRALIRRSYPGLTF